MRTPYHISLNTFKRSEINSTCIVEIIVFDNENTKLER